MGERKVLNKYIPADFDPSLIPRGKKLSAKDGTVPVRMMLPFSIQCSSCSTFLYRGKKFNSKKEPVAGAAGRYLGIQRWRFYIKCTQCSRPVTFLTDPKNADYEMESGGTRNYEVYKDKAATEEQAAADLEKSEKEDPMKALENRVLDSQREMADLDNLEEIKAMNARHVQLLSASSAAAAKRKKHAGTDRESDNDDNDDDDSDDLDPETRAIFKAIDAKRKRAADAAKMASDAVAAELSAEDEALIKSIRFGKSALSQLQQQQSSFEPATLLRRLDAEDEAAIEERRQQEADRIEEQQQKLLEKAAQKSSSCIQLGMPAIKIKRKRQTPQNESSACAMATRTDEDGLQSTTKRPKEDEDEKLTDIDNGAQTVESKKLEGEKQQQEPPEKASDAKGLAGLLGGYGSSSDSESV